MKVNEIFIINQGHQITDEEIYLSSGEIPIYTAGNEIKGYGKNSLITSDQLPCITYPTKGFSGIVTVQKKLFDANNTAVLILKEQYKDCINLEYMALLLKNILMEYTTAGSGVSYLNKDIVAEIELDIPVDTCGKPVLKVQNTYVQYYERVHGIKRLAQEELLKTKALIDVEIIPSHYIEKKVKEIAVLNKGSNRISEEMIYRNFEKNGIPVFSSATENEGLMGSVSRECFDSFEKQGAGNELTWATNGYYAGKVFYRNSEYLYSEKCGRLILRKEYKNKILPKFIWIMLNQVTYKYRTSEATNCKLDIIHMEEIPVKIPVKKNGEFDITTQKKIIEAFERAGDIEKKLRTVLDDIELML